MTLDFNIHSINVPKESGGSITPSGTKSITENGVYDVTNYANASVNVEGTTPTGTTTITANGTYDVTDYATASVNVPSTEPTLVTKTITSNGTYNASSDDADGYSSVSVNVESTQPVITSINVTPTTAAQTFTAPTGTDGYSPINVSAVTSAIDSNITAGNIKKDVSILGVTGTYEGSGGGGTQEVRGSWVVPQAVLDLEDAFDEWTQTFTASRKYLYGVLLTKGIGMVKVNNVNKSTGVNSIVTSNGGSVEWLDNTSAIVTFTNQDADNWLVYENVYAFDDITIVTPYNKYLSDDFLLNASIRYLIIKDNTSNTTVLGHSPFTSSTSYGLANLESVKAVNVKLGTAFKDAEMRGAGRKYMPPISSWDSDVPDSSVISSFSSYAHLLPNLPYGLDFSSSSTALTLGVAECGMNNIKEAYIKLPNANFTIRYNSGILFSADNWEYIADNAPTVSGKTLTMGDINVAICGGASGTIISTLTNKGWTVN